MNLGSGPILSLNFTNTTIAANFLGTAAATVLNSSLGCVYARSMSIFNRTGNDLELIIGTADPGTAAAGAIFVPGITSGFTNGYMYDRPIAISQGEKLMARTYANAPITVSATTFLRIDFWA